MDTTPGENADRQAVPRLHWARRLTEAAMAVERAWPLALPLVLVCALFAGLSWFGVFRILPDGFRLLLAVLFGLAALAALVPLSRYRHPAHAEIDRRIESANRLAHAPLRAQTDRASGTPDAFAAALWREHQQRMAARLSEVGGASPRPGIPRRDPWALRAAVALFAVVGLAFSQSPSGGRLSDAFRAHAGGVERTPVRVDAWVTPPAYTGRAPIFLTAETARADGPVSVPEGSKLSLRASGGSGEETLEFLDAAGNRRAIEPDAPSASATPAPAGALQFSATLTADGVVTLRSDGSDARSWTFAVLPDKPPVIRFAAEPRQALNGTLELAYTIEDDYGASAAAARFERAEAPGPSAHPLYGAPEMPLALPRRGAKDAPAKTARDLTEHPWAGTPVKLALTATDAAGHKAQSEEKTLRLPERPFSNPLARALVEQRRLLALDANSKPRVLDLMDAVTLRPEDTFANMADFLAIASARTRLKMASDDDALRDVVSYLWEIALGIEAGNLSAAEQRLRQAEQALEDALKNGASEEEIARLMQELRQAMQDYLREFAQRQQQNQNLAQQMPQNGQEIRPSDLQRMLDQIENLARSGARDKAQELLSQLRDMMNNLQASRGQPGNGEPSEARRQMDKLGEIMRRQQELMNDTFRLDRQQRGEPGQQSGQQPGNGRQQGEGGEGGEERNGEQGGGGMTPDELAEALRRLEEGQGKLRGELGDLMRQLDESGIKPGEGFGDAGSAMGRAGKALGDADGERAVGEQGQALEALRRGAQDMMRQMQQAAEGEQRDGADGQRQRGADRDPLGRPRATTGPDFGDSVKVPDEIDVQRARRILEAIRKRLGNALSPELEKDYLERLLDFR